MENFKKSSEDSMISDEWEEKSDEEQFFNINPYEEKLFWEKTILPLLVYPPQICSNCSIKAFNINECQKNDILNPFYIRCSNKVCRFKKNLRE